MSRQACDLAKAITAGATILFHDASSVFMMPCSRNAGMSGCRSGFRWQATRRAQGDLPKLRSSAGRRRTCSLLPGQPSLASPLRFGIGSRELFTRWQKKVPRRVALVTARPGESRQNNRASEPAAEAGSRSKEPSGVAPGRLFSIRPVYG